MNNTEAIKNLKKSLDSIYENFRTRIDENAWKTVIKPAYEADKTETSIIVTDFLQTHSYMPVSCLHSICDAIDLKNSPAQMANIFGVKTIERLFENMTVRSPINYDYIPDSCDENQIKSIVDTAREVRKLVNNSQQYLASLEIEKLQQLCPEHPDVLDMQNDIASLYTGMVEKLRQLVNANNKKEEYELEIKKTEKEADIIMEQGGVSKVISFYENIIFEKPSFSFAHFELGKLHLKTGQYSRALHLADILFERPEDKTEAYILKGMVMEELSKYEDALFYYSSAYRSDTKNTEAYNCKQRLLGILDGKSAMDFCDQRSDINEIKAEKNITKNIKSSDNFKDIGYTLNAIEEMIGKGRFSQAYYEIRRVTFGRNEHEILAFLDAFILYMLNKEKEARDLFKKLSNSNIFGNLAVYMIDDIDRKIVDEGIFDGMSEEDTAAIYFNLGNFDKAFAALSGIPMGEMSSSALVIRGRCEISSGRLDSAYDLFERALQKNPEEDGVHELMGMICQAKGEIEKALDYYNRAIVTDKASSAACILKAEILIKKERYAEFLEYYKALENSHLEVHNVDGFLGMLYVHKSSQNLRKGVEHIQRAIAAGSSRTEFYITLIELYMNRGMYNTALNVIEEGFFNLQASEELLMKKAEILLVLKKYRALDFITGIMLTTFPESAELQYMRGMICSEQRNNKEAAKWFKNAYEASPKIHKYAYALADKCFEIGDMKSALQYYTKSLELDKNDSISLKRRALIYKKSGKDREAVEDIERAMDLSPEDPEIYLIAGDILNDYIIEDVEDYGFTDITGELVSDEVTEGDEYIDEDIVEISEKETENIDKSEKKKGILDDLEKDSEYYFSKALELDPNYKQGYMTRARYYAENKEIEKSFSDIDKAMELSNGESDVYMVRGIVYQLAGRNEEAVSDFRHVVKAGFMLPQSYSYISKCLNSQKKYEDALNAAEEGLKADENYINLYLNRGVANFYLNNYIEAIDDFKKIIIKQNEVGTSTVEGAYRFRGLAYERLGRDEEAIHDYRRVLRYDSAHADIRERLEILEHKAEEAKSKRKFRLFGGRRKD